MKKILTIILLTVISLSGYAQRGGGAPNWISIAVKGGYGNSIFFCKQAKDVSDGKFEYEPMAPSYSVGGRLGVVFVDKIGASVEYLSAGYKPKNTFNNGDTKLSSNFDMKASDLLLLARYTGEYGFYAEFGPKFTTAKEITRDSEEADILGVKIPANGVDVSDRFNDKFTSLVFGLGITPYNGDRVLVSLGLRASYCMNSFYKEGLAYGIAKLDAQALNPEIKPFSVQAMLEVCYHFARFGSATCGKQKIIFFK
ncbi:MAG: hypothetical protein II956_08060 [Bacteroidales bacterium]|nr:hypothetical protein [Bacteroidales bacterium]